MASCSFTCADFLFIESARALGQACKRNCSACSSLVKWVHPLFLIMTKMSTTVPEVPGNCLTISSQMIFNQLFTY